MDYNIENKGFVCFFYRLINSRIFWLGSLAFMLVISAGFLIWIGSNKAVIDVLISKLNSARLIVIIGVIFGLIAPKSFSFKIIAIGIIFWGVILGVDYSMADFSNISKINFVLSLPLNEILPSIFEPNFSTKNDLNFIKIFKIVNLISFILIAISFLVLTLSWFIYNARSSEKI